MVLMSVTVQPPDTINALCVRRNAFSFTWDPLILPKASSSHPLANLCKSLWLGQKFILEGGETQSKMGSPRATDTPPLPVADV